MAGAATLASWGGLSIGAALAQPKRWRIGVLNTERESDAVRRGIPFALSSGLKELGYLEGSNIELVWRFANSRYELLPNIGAELIASKPDVLVTHSSQGVTALAGLTKSIPIVAQSTNDPVELGVARSLSRPGGNVTGTTFFREELVVKRLQILKEIDPRLIRIGVNLLRGNPANASLKSAMDLAAQQLKVELHWIEVQDVLEMGPAMAQATRSGVRAMALAEHPIFLSKATALADLAKLYRMLVVGFDGYAVAGGAVEFGVDFIALWHRVGYFVDKILKGTPAGEIPIERPSKFNLTVNRYAVEAQKLRIPEPLMLRATQIIE